jgi:aldose 1-epimerase
MILNSEFRFKILEEKFGAYSQFKLFDSQTSEYVSILPHLGGSVNEMVLNHQDQLIPIIDGYKSEKDVNENLETSFKGSNLFPYPNRIADARFSFEGKDYELPMNFPHEKNAIHGLVYKKNFNVIEQESGEIGCKLFIKYMVEEKIEGYPFNYQLEITYKLHAEKGFECETKISNLDDQHIPFGHGWHPYFITGKSSINDLWLQFPSDEILEVNQRGIPTGKSEKYTNFNQLQQIAQTELDSCFLLEESEKPAEIHIVNRTKNFGYTIWQERGINKYNFLQIYTPPKRKSIAIEPMTCAPNVFNNGKGLIVLSPLERVSVSWGIKRFSVNE